MCSALQLLSSNKKHGAGIKDELTLGIQVWDMRSTQHDSTWMDHSDIAHVSSGLWLTDRWMGTGTKRSLTPTPYCDWIGSHKDVKVRISCHVTQDHEGSMMYFHTFSRFVPLF